MRARELFVALLAACSTFEETGTPAADAGTDASSDAAAVSDAAPDTSADAGTDASACTTQVITATRFCDPFDKSVLGPPWTPKAGTSGPATIKIVDAGDAPSPPNVLRS